MDVTFTILCIIIGIVGSAILFFRRRFSYWKVRGVPYLEPSFPYGNLEEVGKSKHFVHAIDEIYRETKSQSPFGGSYFSISPTAIITDLDLIKSVLIRDFECFSDRSFYCNEKDDPLSGTLFFMQGSRWKLMRSKLSPAFSSGKMKFMYPTLLNVCHRFIDHLSEETESSHEIEMKEILARYTTDVIGECAFGIECNSLTNSESEFRKFGGKVFSQPKYTKFVKEFLGQCPEIGRFFRMKLFEDDVIQFFTKTIRATVNFREQQNYHRKDFVDLLIQMKNGAHQDDFKLDTMDIIAQVFGFFLAAFETSSSAMTFALYELAADQALQEKARQHIQEVLAKYDGEISYEATMDMNYLGQILMETLRKYPVLMAVSRKASQDYQVPNTDKVIEKGTGVIIPIYSVHHDPEIYSNPDEFNPARFSPEKLGSRHPMSFLGFGNGPRNCIGMRFGVMQSRVGLATLLRKFRFKLSPKVNVPLELDPKSIVLAPKGGLHLIVEKI